jgi:uncharacterized protein
MIGSAAAMETISLAQLRRHVVAHQAYSGRFRRAGAADVEAAVRRLGAVQLDSITTVDRAHRLTLGSRIGAFPAGTVSELLGEGRIFEFWAHEACLLPIEDYPLYEWRREHHRNNHPWRGDIVSRFPDVVEHVVAEITERGALASRDFAGEGGGGMWNWKPAKQVLEALYSSGELAIAGRDGFQRLYDLRERVIPKRYLDSPTPSEEEGRRGLVLRAVRGRGALTESGISEHCRFRGGAAAARPHVDALAEAGLVQRVDITEGGAPVVVPADAELDGRPGGAVLLSPFDNLLWDRSFVERVFGFRHVIEVYKREHERTFGYYVLPLLVDDRLAGRADLKADRAEGVLRVKAFHREPGVRRSLDAPLERALAVLARRLGLEQVAR